MRRNVNLKLTLAVTEDNSQKEIRQAFVLEIVLKAITGWQGRLWKTLEGPGMIVYHRAYWGLRPINTAHLPAVDFIL
jgi:hypothetical protein